MKSEEEIRKRLQDLKFRYLQRKLRSDLRRRPHNCQFNREHTITKDGEKVTIRLCMLGIERPDWPVDICDTPKQAATCQAFLPTKTREDVEAEFESMLRDPDALREKYRDLLALAWVLGDGQTPSYTLRQRFWLFVTSWWTPRDRRLETEASDDHDQDRD
jgi:hypothetical protein